MKNTVAKICVFLLRKMKYSTIIGFEVTGGEIKCKHYDGLIFDCDFDETKYLTKDSTEFNIPPGKFSVSFPAKEDE